MHEHDDRTGNEGQRGWARLRALLADGAGVVLVVAVLVVLSGASPLKAEGLLEDAASGLTRTAVRWAETSGVRQALAPYEAALRERLGASGAEETRAAALGWEEACDVGLVAEARRAAAGTGDGRALRERHLVLVEGLEGEARALAKLCLAAVRAEAVMVRHARRAAEETQHLARRDAERLQRELARHAEREAERAAREARRHAEQLEREARRVEREALRQAERAHREAMRAARRASVARVCSAPAPVEHARTAN